MDIQAPASGKTARGVRQRQTIGQELDMNGSKVARGGQRGAYFRWIPRKTNKVNSVCACQVFGFEMCAELLPFIGRKGGAVGKIEEVPRTLRIRLGESHRTR